MEFWFYGKFGSNTSSGYDFGVVLMHETSTNTYASAEGPSGLWVGYTGDLTADPTTDGGWRRALYRVPPSMRTNGVRAEFWFAAGASGNDEGLYIDEVRIVGTTDVDVTAIGNDTYGGRLSTPKVAGVVALMLSANPSLTPAEVKDILGSTADDIDVPNEDDKTGAGRVNAFEAVHRGDPKRPALVHRASVRQARERSARRHEPRIPDPTDLR